MSGLGYGSRQLFRRPAPVSDAGGCDWAYMFWDNGMTVTDENTQNITGYTTSYVVGDSINPDEGTGKFEIEATGLYLVQLVTLWTDTFAGGKMARIAQTGGNTIQDTNYWQQWVSEQDLGTNVDMVTCEALIFVDSVSTDVLIQGSVRQTSGVSQDLASADFSIVRLCSVSDPVIS